MDKPVGEIRKLESLNRIVLPSEVRNIKNLKPLEYAEIYVNTSVVSTNTIQTQGTFAHEMGHAFGLDHVSNVNALMHRYSNERLTHVVSLDEHNGINALY